MMIALVGLNANAAIYLVGGEPFGQGWDPSKGVEMTDNGDGTYSFSATVNGAVYFCFADALDSSWDVFNGTHRYGPTGGVDQIINAGEWTATQKQGNGSGSYKFTGSGEKYTVTFNLTKMEFKVDGYVAPITEDVYTVAGSNADLFGTTWAPENADNDMTLVDGLYTWEKKDVELPAGAFEFKVVANHSWDIAYPSNNYYQAVSVKGIYDVKITFNAETKDVACELTLIEEIPDTEEHTYTVAGNNLTLFGTEWDAANEDNNMTLKDGLYTWTKNDVELTVGEILFKVVQDHNWDIAYPSENWLYNVTENGTYNVTITFDATTKDITCKAEPVVVVEDFYTIAGAPEALFGAEWNPGYAANNMTLVDGVYTWTKNDVELTAGYFIEFKVVKNNNWATAWPASNYEYTVAEDGTYDLTITFNPETEEVAFTANKHEEAPAVRGDVDGDGDVTIADVTTLIDALLSSNATPACDCDLDGEVSIADVTTLIDRLLTGSWPAVEMVYTVVGAESVFGSNWDPTDENNNMVKGADGIYTWSKTGVTLYGNFEFKVVGNHDWSIYEWPIGMNNWVANVAEEGVYDIVITFNPEADDADRITCSLTKTGDVDPVEHVYTVAGTENLFGSNWDPADEANNMVKGEDGIYTWTKEDVEFTDYATIEFKVVQDHAWAYAWPSSNWWAEITEAGIYNFVITFDPKAEDTSNITFTATKQQ